ncbi:hypothetical protein HID58_028040 [Brassica napus]|uniref:VQ domain-containing protein n=1 Tax=Brassica napus TaxID=3708 RepID=A0ABQ8CVJ5_BRANA|nr:hypothetical protein HID58_028040 [Brassica napus]
MDKSCNSSGDSASVTSSTGNNHHLRQLNKLSHKISKPTSTSSSSISAAVNQETDHQFPPPPPPQQQPQHQINHGNLHQHQPPQSSRLHRIRPPPLAHVINRPPGLLNNAALVPPPSWSGGFVVPRPTAPLSPLPPLPPVHAAAESPVSSYMRYLQNSMLAMDSNRREFSGLSPLAPLVSPRWYQQQQENAPPPLNSGRPPPPGTVSQAPPQSLGCLSSPKSPYGLLSPSLLLSPTSGQLGFPASPTTVPPLPSPK